MKLTGLVRLGRDAEIRYTQNGDPVANLAGAWDYGRKDADGKRPTQWCRLTLWGERAEKLAEYLTKGKLLFVVCDDVRVTTYERNDGGTGVNLEARIESLEFAGGSREGGNQQGGGAQRTPAPAPAGGGVDDFDDDIPF